MPVALSGSSRGRIIANITGARGAIGLTLGAPIADFEGKFVSIGPDRVAVPLTGTGADEGLRTDLAAYTGAAIVGYKSPGTGAVTRSQQSINRERISLLDYAVGDGSDETNQIQRALDYTKSVSGVLWVPNRTFYASGLVLEYGAAAPIMIQGSGPRSSVFRKFGTSADPVLTVVGTGVLDIYAELRNLSFDGDNMADAALRMIDCARFELHRVGAENAGIGWDFSGDLIFNTARCLTNGCQTGMKVRAGTTTSNLYTIRDHETRSCSDLGMDLGGGASVVLENVEFADCGTTGNVDTGAAVFRNTIGRQTGQASVRITNPYLEIIRGTGIRVEGPPAPGDLAVGETLPNLCFVMEEPEFLNIEGGRCAVIGESGAKIRSSSIRNAKFSGASDVIEVNATASKIEGGFGHQYTENSDHWVHDVTSTSAGVHGLSTSEIFGLGSAGNEITIADDHTIAGASDADTTLYKSGTGRFRFRFEGGYTPLQIERDKFSVFGATPQGQYTLAPVASDLATAIALANSLRVMSELFGFAV